MESVAQITVSAIACRVTKFTTLTVMVSVLIQPLSFSSTMYFEFTVGLTVGLAVLGFTKGPGPVQLKLPLPMAPSVTWAPLQISVSLGTACNGGLSMMTTFLYTVSIQPLLLVTIKRTLCDPIEL